MVTRKRTLAAAVVALILALAVHPARAQTQAVGPTTATPALTLAEAAEGAGRVLIGQLFVVSGLYKIGNFAGVAARMTAVGLPAAEVLLVPTIALEVGAGLALAANWHTDWAAAALAAFVVAVTPLFHNYWAIPDAVAAMQQHRLFVRNLAVLGGLLTVFGGEQQH